MRKTTRKGLIKKLDDLTSEITRLKEKRCVCCGSYERLTNGHIFSRRHLNTRWDISPNGNCHTQCWPCNRKHVFDTFPYFEWYRKNHGQTAFNALYRRWSTTVHWKTYDLEKLYQTLSKIKDRYECDRIG